MEEYEPTQEDIEQEERKWEAILEWNWQMQQLQEQWGRNPKNQQLALS